MPNILITNNAQFKPFSYEELVRPIEYATAQQNAYEDAYNTLGDAADMIASNLDPNDPGSQQALNIYNTYNAKLGQARDALMQNSFMDPNTKRNLLDLKKLYTSGMQKVNSAITARQAALKDIADRKAKNPNMIFSPIGTVDEYLNGTAPNIASLDLKDYRNRAEKLAEAAAARVYRDGIEYVGNGMFKVKNSQGYDDIETLEAVLRTPKTDENGNILYDANGNPQLAYPDIAYMYNQLYEDPNIHQYLAAMPDEDSYKYAAGIIDSAIREGMLDGMKYKETVSYHNMPRSSGSGSHTSTKPKVGNEDDGKGYQISTTPMMLKNEDEKERKRNSDRWRTTYGTGLAGPNLKYSLIGRKTKGIRSREEYFRYSLQDDYGEKIDFKVVDSNGNPTQELVDYIRRNDGRIESGFTNKQKQKQAKIYAKDFINSRNSEYDDFYDVYHNTLNMNPGDKWSDFEGKIAEYERKGTGLNVNGIEMPAWEDSSKLIERLYSLPGAAIHEVKGTNSDKTLILDKKAANLSSTTNPITGEKELGYVRWFVNPAKKDKNGRTYVFASVNGHLYAVDPAQLVGNNLDILLQGFSGLFGSSATESDVENFFNSNITEDSLQYNRLNDSTKRILQKSMNDITIPQYRRRAYELISDSYFTQDTHHYTDSQKATRTNIED